MLALQTRCSGPVGSAADALAVLEVAHRLHDRLAAALRPSRLTYAAYRVLARLDRSQAAVEVWRLPAVRDGRGRTVAEILADLEVEGLVRVVEGSPGRLARAQLTELGRDRLRDAATRLDGPTAEFASGFTAHERGALGRLLDMIDSGHATC